VDVHVAAFKFDHPRLGNGSLYLTCRQIGHVLFVLPCSEYADSRHHAAFMAARSQSLDQQSVGFVTASIGRVVKRILGQ
jgi:hypothetical protein